MVYLKELSYGVSNAGIGPIIRRTCVQRIWGEIGKDSCSYAMLHVYLHISAAPYRSFPDGAIGVTEILATGSIRLARDTWGESCLLSARFPGLRPRRSMTERPQSAPLRTGRAHAIGDSFAWALPSMPQTSTRL